MRLTYKWQAALIVALGLFMAILDNTIVSVTLPQMQRAFHTDFETITWVVTGYFLAQAAIIPVVGYLSDRIGTKIVFLTALALFTVGSAMCAFAPTKELLIAFRVIQGIGGGALLPLAFAIIYRLFPPTERGPATAVIGVPLLLAPAFGPTIGGYLSTTFDWSAIFTVNIPIGIVAFLLALFILHGKAPEREANGDVQPERRGFDIVGLLLSMVGFTALVYGITQAGPHGWGDPTVIRFLIGGGVALVAFVIVELFVRDPVLDMRLFLNYTFSVSNILMWAVGAVLFGSVFLIPLFFENVQGLSSLTTGEILISQGLAAAVGISIAGRLYNRVGPRILAATGALLMAVSMIGFTRLEVGTTGLSVQVWLIIRGLGLGLLNTPLQTLALSVVSNRAMARASSLVNVTRMVFSALGVSVLTTYLTQQTVAHANNVVAALHTLPLTGVAATCVAAAGRNVSVLRVCIGQNATTMGLNDTFLLVLIVCAVCAVLALFVGRDPAIEAAKRAKERGEMVETEKVPALSE
jgi:EmrB/QacA subfamily drug resistance transporter